MVEVDKLRIRYSINVAMNGRKKQMIGCCLYGVVVAM